MISRSRAALAVLLAGWLAASPALADTTLKPLERPDAATITVPDSWSGGRGHDL